MFQIRSSEALRTSGNFGLSPGRALLRTRNLRLEAFLIGINPVSASRALDPECTEPAAPHRKLYGEERTFETPSSG